MLSWVFSVGLIILLCAYFGDIFHKFIHLLAPYPAVTWDNNTGVYHLSSILYFGSLDFIYDPYAYITRARSLLPSKWLRFNVSGGRTVVVPEGNVARRVILNSKSFSMTEGYGLLSPGLKNSAPWQILEDSNLDSFGYYMRHFVRTEIIESYLKPVLAGVTDILETWGEIGIMDPFERYSEIIFRIGLHVTLGSEAADDADIVRSVARDTYLFHDQAHPSALILPLIPTPGRIRMLMAGLRMWRLVSRIATSRKKENYTIRNDVLQVLLDEGADMHTCTRMTSTALFAATMSTSATIVWLHVFLTQCPEWLTRVNAEITAFRSEYISDNSSTTTALASGLADVPLTIWERAFPILNLCISETIRLVAIGALSRRNVGADRIIAGHTVRRGDYVLLLTGDVLLDSAIFEDPLSFQPDRNLDQIPSKSMLGIAWGAGTHACPGQRFARCMVKLVTVLVLSRFELSVLDTNGKLFTGVPQVNRQIFTLGTPIEKISFQYKRRDCS